MKEVSIIGATFYGNRGAEAMLSTTIGELRQRYGPDIRFNVFSYYPSRDRRLVDDRNVTIYSSTPKYLVMNLVPSAFLFAVMGSLGMTGLRRWLPQSIQALARSKALVCLAGVSFVQGRAKFLPFNVATILPAMLVGTPVVKLAQAMGPFNSRLNLLVSRFFLGRCRHIFTRGEKTQDHLKRLLKRATNFERADDVAFLFKPDYCLSRPSGVFQEKLQEVQSLKAQGRRVVGVCPSIVVAKRAEAAGWDYAQCIAELIRRLVDAGNCVAIYPNATRGEDLDQTHNNDLPLLAQIHQRLPVEVAAQVHLFSGSLNAAQVHKIINACTVHAVSRFHAMVGALASGVPVMVIGWSHKYLEVMDRFGQGDMVIDYEKGNLEPILARVSCLIDQNSERAAAITGALPAVKSLSGRQFEWLGTLVSVES